jgi:hypothetical protein
MAPYLYVIPRDLAPFEGLLLGLGVRESFSAEQYVALLADLHAASAGKVLESAQLDQALAAVQVRRPHYPVA